MKRFFFALSFLFSIPLVARGQVDERPVPNSELYSSKKFGLGVGTGNFMSPIGGTSLQGFYSLTPDMLLEFQKWEGTHDVRKLIQNNYEDRLMRFDIHVMQTQVRWKYFLGQSFYFAGGLGHRDAKFKLQANGTSGQDLMADFKVFSTQLNIAVGNTWMFDSGLFLGCEWLALSLPIGGTGFSSNVSLSASGGGEISNDSVKQDAERAARKSPYVSTAGFATLHFGLRL